MDQRQSKQIGVSLEATVFESQCLGHSVAAVGLAVYMYYCPEFIVYITVLTGMNIGHKCKM